MPADVFISYSRSASGAQVARIRQGLSERGITFFLDTRDIDDGDVFPERIAEGLLDSKVVLVVLDDGYFERQWCAYEFQVAVAPYRAAPQGARGDDSLAHIVLALAQRNESVTAHLPPPLARENWPRVETIANIVNIVAKRLQHARDTLRQRLAGCEQDSAVMRLRSRGAIPPAGSLVGRPFTGMRVPRSLRDHFIGRSQELWRVFHILETGRVRGASNACAIVGTAGAGKTQLAAEYMWRYAPGHYPGGVIWIDADVDERALEEQLRDALRAFAPNEPRPPVGDHDALKLALDKNVAAVAAHSRILWVIDNVPVPRPGRPLQPVKAWCPVLNLVDVLCTSRRGRLLDNDLFDPEAMILVGELPAPAAVEMITRAPVQRGALSDYEWRIVVEWVGCLPLAIRILHTSLDGFVTAKDVLARAKGEEPARALDEDVESLREDIAEGYLRGVAEVLHDSYAELRDRPALLRRAHLMAWLAPTPTRDDLVTEWISHTQLAQLANRGWIDVLAADDVHNVWRMHRVISSFLRTRSLQPASELTELTHWLSHALPGAAEHLIPHADAVLSWLALPGLADAQAVHTPLFDIAGSDPADPTTFLARYEAATLLVRWGEADALLQRLRSRLEGASLAAISGVIDMLPAIATTGAAELCAELLRSPSANVRHAAMAIAEEFVDAACVADALLDALLAAADVHHLFDQHPDKPKTEFLVDGYVLRASGPDGKDLRLNWNHPFWKTIPAEQAREALIRLAVHPNSLRAVEHFRHELQSAHSPEMKRQAIIRLGLLLRAMSTPIPAKFRPTSVLDRITGHIERRMDFRHPIIGDATHEHYAALVDEVVSGDDATSRIAARVSFVSKFGMEALSSAVHNACTAEDYGAALRIGEAVAATFPDHINAHWWLGLALAGLQRDDEALAHFGRLLGLQPKFFRARIERCAIFSKRHDRPAAKREMDLANGAQDAHIQIRRAYYYLEHGFFDEALGAADFAVRVESGNPDPWLARAYVHHRLNEREKALFDVRRARDLGAQDPLIGRLLETSSG